MLDLLSISWILDVSLGFLCSTVLSFQNFAVSAVDSVSPSSVSGLSA